MTALLEKGLANIENITFAKNVIDNSTTEDLINFSIESETENEITSQAKKQLIESGKDNIQERIGIKKYLKAQITKTQEELKIIEESKDKKSLKEKRVKFLAAVSLVDKLQLEWQKHDLKISR